MARVNFDEEYYCGYCGKTHKKDEIGFRLIFGVKVPVEWKDGKARCPDCGNTLRCVPRVTDKSAKVARL